MKQPLSLLLLSSFLLLQGCGSGGSGGSGSGPVVSGTVSLTRSLIQDDDINDSNAPYRSNNNPFEPQVLTTNVFTLQGFASAEGTQEQGVTDPSGQRFYADVDDEDYFQVTLQAGQRILLQVADFTESDSFSGDLDLYLYAPGQSDPLDLSVSTDASESITVPYDGTFLVNVYAYEGISKYILSVSGSEGSPGQCTAASTASGFIHGEAIVQWRDDPQQLSSQSQKPGHKVTQKRDFTLGDLHVTSQSSNGRYPVKARFTRSTSAATIRSAASQVPAGWNDAKDTINAIKALNTRDDVVFAEPNYRRTALLTPNDSFYDRQFHYDDISLPAAWDITTGSADVIVAVIDSGVLMSHPDLSNKLISGYDFISDPEYSNDGDGIDSNPDDTGGCTADPCTSEWHGTHVSGTVGADTDNGEGVAGVGWQTMVMPLRVLGLDSSGSNYDVLQAMLYAAGLDNDSGTVPPDTAAVINLSLGGPNSSRAEQQIISQVRDAGVIIVAAAGNESSNCPSYPAAYDGVISVSASAPDDTLAYYSNFGESIDVAAPGGDISYTVRNGLAGGIASTYVDDSSGSREPGYAQLEGTSMATPHVSGVIALMKAVYPAMTPAEFDALLASGNITDDLGSAGRDDSFGYGLINARKAVNAALDLAGGGDLPAPLTSDGLSSNPTSVAIGTNSTASLVLSYSGDSAPASVTHEETASWLSVSDSQAGSDGLGTYPLSVDRSGLSDGIYSASIIFTADTGDEVIVPVTMQVGDAAAPYEQPPVYVLLINDDTGDVVTETVTDTSSGYFAIGNVPEGTYRVQAGSDIDVDLLICQSAEVCGEYPDLIVVGPEGISGLEIDVELVPTTGTAPLAVKAVKK
ncbi:MAG: peptidase S8 [Oceanospirillaceae bacterium]|nr:peptidase S8 [Oceanospirillaceae bacterium]MAQ99153.1 peptidase S8 [Oceanospirillaceae bacterium]MAQ99162.1 peptidase S8 [Oceanospirillaceae bacterium]|tara:strand:- start:2818 stop:5397 length:2580 start_codon:yes stop_codon:yes gene_type:complete